MVPRRPGVGGGSAPHKGWAPTLHPCTGVLQCLLLGQQHRRARTRRPVPDASRGQPPPGRTLEGGRGLKGRVWGDGIRAARAPANAPLQSSEQSPESGFMLRPTPLNPDSLGPPPPTPRSRSDPAPPCRAPRPAPSAVPARPLADPDGTSQSLEATRGPESETSLGNEEGVPLTWVRHSAAVRARSPPCVIIFASVASTGAAPAL